MMQTVDAVLKHWRPVLEKEFDGAAVKLMLERARRIITKAKLAEDEGRIADMQPLFAVPNLDNPKVAEGFFYLEIRYRPVSDGFRGATESFVKALLTPDDLTPKEPKYSQVELMFAG